MIVKELVTKIGFVVDSNPINQAEKSLAGFKSAALKLGALATATSGSIFAIAKLTANLGDRLLEASQKTGFSTQALQKLQFAAKLTGVNHEELNLHLITFSRQLAEARMGTGEMVDEFKRLGITQDQINSKTMTTEDLFRLAAKQIAKMPDGFKKTAAASKIFGRSGADMIPLINEMKDGMSENEKVFRKYGFTLSRNAIKNSDKFNDKLETLRTVITGIGIRVGTALLPTMIRIVDKTIEWVSANKLLISQALIDFLTAVINAIASILEGLNALLPLMRPFFDMLKSKFGGVGGVLAALAAGFAGIQTIKAVASLLSFGKSIIDITGTLIKLVSWLFVVRDVSTATGAAMTLAFQPIIGAVLAFSAALAGIGLLWRKLVPEDFRKNVAAQGAQARERQRRQDELNGIPTNLPGVPGTAGIAKFINGLVTGELPSLSSIFSGPGSLGEAMTGAQNVSINAPMNFNVTAAEGEGEKTANLIAKKIDDHFNQKLRETSRATKSVVKQ